MQVAWRNILEKHVRRSQKANLGPTQANVVEPAQKFKAIHQEAIVSCKEKRERTRERKENQNPDERSSPNPINIK
jgi:hypothetical protein